MHSAASWQHNRGRHYPIPHIKRTSVHTRTDSNCRVKREIRFYVYTSNSATRPPTTSISFSLPLSISLSVCFTFIGGYLKWRVSEINARTIVSRAIRTNLFVLPRRGRNRRERRNDGIKIAATRIDPIDVNEQVEICVTIVREWRGDGCGTVVNVGWCGCHYRLCRRNRDVF